MVISDNGGFLVISLLKALSGNKITSRVRTQDLTMLVSPDDDSVYALVPF
jgi:hypothetical protein